MKMLDIVFSAPPERDHEHLSSTSRLLEKQREVTEAETLLTNQKEVICIHPHSAHLANRI
jgi:hypothetical protein